MRPTAMMLLVAVTLTVHPALRMLEIAQKPAAHVQERVLASARTWRRTGLVTALVREMAVAEVMAKVNVLAPAQEIVPRVFPCRVTNCRSATFFPHAGGSILQGLTTWLRCQPRLFSRLRELGNASPEFQEAGTQSWIWR